MKKLYTNSRAILRETVATGNKILDIPKNTVVELLAISENVQYSGMDTTCYKVGYSTSGKYYEGYSYSGFFEPYEEELPQDVVDIDLATPETTDAKQYVLWDGRKKYNFCGEICCTYILDEPLSVVANTWKQKSPNIVARIFDRANVDRGTGVGDLLDLLESNGVCDGVKFSEYFKDPVLGRTLFTPWRAKDAVDKGDLIIGVKINKYTGRLQTSGILHWVVLIDVKPEGIDFGFVTIYNPFMNRVEQYSWNEFITSAGNIDGVYVPLDVDDGDVEVSEYVDEDDDIIETPKLTLGQKIDILWDWYLETGD